MRLANIFSIALALACAALPVRAEDSPDLEPIPLDKRQQQEPTKFDQPQKPQQQQQQPQQQKGGKKKPPQPYQPKEPTPIRDASNQTEIVVHSYLWLRQQHIVMQKRDFSCGAACLATIARYYWDDKVDEDVFLRALDTILTDEEIADRIKNGLAMSDLRRASVIVGYESVVGKLTFDKLAESKIPLVVGIKPGGHKHFVVYRGTDWEWVYVADPIRGNIRMPVREFVDQWQEKAVLVVHKPGAKIKERSPLSLTPADLNLGDMTEQYIRADATMPPQTKQTLR